eukprot:CAMPEP_0197240470 /NCGR_PEP_ID=MMETSP1429-20130617/6755_1 /TAXON_ID=49237 /ORGANISM="Chaetoceros  sp., Strain UNC1202" /LENGTH=69 /DNA_ID=CAMNT_0042700115 /DNA_START=158 /DNA_END=367 /DNA_ORIENTATION=+
MGSAQSTTKGDRRVFDHLEDSISARVRHDAKVMKMRGEKPHGFVARKEISIKPIHEHDARDADTTRKSP